MKKGKILSAVLIATIFASLVVMPSFAETVNNPVTVEPSDTNFVSANWTVSQNTENYYARPTTVETYNGSSFAMKIHHKDGYFGTGTITNTTMTLEQGTPFNLTFYLKGTYDEDYVFYSIGTQEYRVSSIGYKVDKGDGWYCYSVDTNATGNASLAFHTKRPCDFVIDNVELYKKSGTWGYAGSNGDFENSYLVNKTSRYSQNDWTWIEASVDSNTTHYAEVVDSAAYSGNKSLYLRYPDAIGGLEYARLRRNVSLSAGTQYEVSMYVNGQYKKAPGVILFYTEHWDFANNIFNNDYTDWTWEDVSGSNWKKVSMTFTPPSNEDYIFLVIYNCQGTFFDDFKIKNTSTNEVICFDNFDPASIEIIEAVSSTSMLGVIARANGFIDNDIASFGVEFIPNALVSNVNADPAVATFSGITMEDGATFGTVLIDVPTTWQNVDFRCTAFATNELKTFRSESVIASINNTTLR